MVDAVGSVRVIPAVASGGSFLGFLTACFLVIYPDVEPSGSEQDLGLVGVARSSDPNGDQSLARVDLTYGDILKKTDNHSVA